MRARAKSKRSPGRPTAGVDGEARELLLTAAAELFAKQGVAATSFAEIAKRVGLTPAMMHYYFRDRDHLLDCLVGERLAGLVASVWDPVTQGTVPAAAIGGIVERTLIGIDRMPWIPSTWMREVLNEGGLLRSRVLRQLPLEKARMVSEAIAQGQGRGVLNREIDPVMIVFSAIGLVMMHSATARFYAQIFQRRLPDRESLRRHITALLLHGLDAGNEGRRKQDRK